MPEVTVSSVRPIEVHSRSVQLTWDPVTCSQRLGLRPRYDIIVIDSDSLATIMNLSVVATESTPPYWLYLRQPYTQYTVQVRYANEYGAAPYTQYTVQVRYANEYGAAPHGSEVLVTTKPDGTFPASFAGDVEVLSSYVN